MTAGRAPELASGQEMGRGGGVWSELAALDSRGLGSSSPPPVSWAGVYKRHAKDPVVNIRGGETERLGGPLLGF